MDVNCKNIKYLWPTVETSHLLEQLQLLQYSKFKGILVTVNYGQIQSPHME